MRSRLYQGKVGITHTMLNVAYIYGELCICSSLCKNEGPALQKSTQPQDRRWKQAVLPVGPFSALGQLLSIRASVEVSVKGHLSHGWLELITSYTHRNKCTLRLTGVRGLITDCSHKHLRWLPTNCRGKKHIRATAGDKTGGEWIKCVFFFIAWLDLTLLKAWGWQRNINTSWEATITQRQHCWWLCLILTVRVPSTNETGSQF